MKIVQGWPFNLKLNAFIINLRILNPNNEKYIDTQAIFDTGFSGYLGLDSDSIKKLHLTKIGRGDAFTVDGNSSFDNYEAKIEILTEKKQLLKRIQSLEEMENYIVPIQNFKIPLIGMKAIKQCSWMMIEGKDLLCLLQ